MIAKHKGEIPVVVLLLPFLIGISLGRNLFTGINLTCLTIAFFSLAAAFIILNLNYGRFNLYRMRWLGGTLITVILFLSGWLSVIRYNELNRSDHFSKKPAQYFVVRVNSEPVLKNGLIRFTAGVVENINKSIRSLTSGTLLITIKDSSAASLCYGDELLIPAKYNAVEPPHNPAGFNYKKYLANQNIYYQAFLYPKQLVIVNTNTGNPLIARSLKLRQQLVEKFKRNMRDTNAIAVASTLILGYKADLSDDVLQAYSKTGTIHVLSVSGAHVAILYLLLTLVFSFLDRLRYGKLIRAILIISIIWYYALLTGFSPAVCRAAVMISMVIIGKSYNKYINSLNILAISAFLLLLYDPLFITDVGFQLSYLAVSGLIVFQPIVYQWLSFKNKLGSKLWALCSVSIAAQVITFPLSAFYFHQFPVYFLISNLFIVVPSAIIMYTGIIYLLLPQTPLVSHALAFVLEKTIILMDKGLTIVEHAPYASISKIWITPAEYLLLYAVIISLFYFFYNKKLWLMKLSLICILLLSISWSVKKISLSRSNSIAWLDLKKHKGIIFKNGNAAIVLSDIKNTDKIYRYSIQPYLDSCQVTNIRLYDLNSDINTEWFKKKYSFIKFLNTNVFIFNRELKNSILSPKIKTDYIYISGNCDDCLTAINTNFDCHTLVIDGSASDNLIAGVEKYAKNMNVNYKILKRNNSFISLSN